MLMGVKGELFIYSWLWRRVSRWPLPAPCPGLKGSLLARLACEGRRGTPQSSGAVSSPPAKHRGRRDELCSAAAAKNWDLQRTVKLCGQRGRVSRVCCQQSVYPPHSFAVDCRSVDAFRLGAGTGDF